MKNIKRKLLIVFLVVSGFALTGFITSKSDIYFEIAKNLELFGKVYKEISYNYVDDINPQEFMRAGIKGMLSTLDPYTVFVDESKQQDIDLMTNGKYGGIGVSIGVRGDNVTITEIIDSYSAQKQGLRVGDIIIEASGVGINARNIDQVSNLVKGDPGTTVELKILRYDTQDTLNFSLIREEIILKNITYAKFFPESSNNVYIKLSNFSRTAGDELRSSLKTLSQQKPVNSIILDLRGNPGGLLDVAVDVCEKFLEREQLIVSTKGKDQTSLKKYFAQEQPVAGKEKLVVLINGSSASASEIVAGAIQDHDRGVILGTQSFGKGLVQTIIPLTGNTSLKITTAKYYTPSGRSIQKIDYSKDNPIIENADSLLIDPYQTDNKRLVYSAGGIMPDTTVEIQKSSELLNQLLAKGLIFSFADRYLYENPDADFKGLVDDKVINSFSQFLKEKNFNYTSSIRKRLDEIIQELKAEEGNTNLTESLSSASLRLEGEIEMEMLKFKDEIMIEIMSELANRYVGTEQSFEVRLQRDQQVAAAISLIKDSTVYHRLLNKN